MKKIRVRIAPSPTGDPHVGTAYIALFNYVFAKQNNGDFIIRIEDTDRARFSAESERGILKYIKWLGLNWDEGPDIGGPIAPYRQSERDYKEFGDLLLERGDAYRCFCTEERLSRLREMQTKRNLPPGYDGHCRSLPKETVEEYLREGRQSVIRLRVPKEGNTVVKDFLRGEIEFENVKIDDQVLIKSDGMPTYHMASVVDDHLMKISHVIRAEEWIPSTPKHVLIYRAFGWEEPTWIHMPLLRNSDKSKISKRKNAVSLEYYFKQGYLKEALLNFLGLMGWHSKRGEIFSLDEMIEEFDFKNVSLGGPVFDVEKLRWINREYMRKSENSKLIELLTLEQSTTMERIVEEFKESAHTLTELSQSISQFLRDPKENLDMIEEKAKAIELLSRPESKTILASFIEKLKHSDITSLDDAKAFVEGFQKDSGLPAGKVLPVIRVAALGLTRGVEVAKIVYLLPKEQLMERLEHLPKVTSV